MDRRGILKLLIVAPIAAITFNKTSEATEKIKYREIDLDEELPELDLGLVNGSGTYRHVRCSG